MFVCESFEKFLNFDEDIDLSRFQPAMTRNNMQDVDFVYGMCKSRDLLNKKNKRKKKKQKRWIFSENQAWV